MSATLVPPTPRVLRGSDPSLALVVVTGEIDLLTAPAVLTTIRTELDAGTRTVVVDVSGVRFCAASGLGVLAEARAHARHLGAEVYLTAPSPPVLRLLARAGRARVDPRVPIWPLTPALPPRSPIPASTGRGPVDPAGPGWGDGCRWLG